MNLELSYGYPYPYPLSMTHALHTELTEAAPAYRLVVKGVSSFQQKLDATIQFIDEAAFNAAQAITGWKRSGEGVLEVPTYYRNMHDAYKHPAIIVGNIAYCAYQLVEVDPQPMFYVRDAEGDQDLIVRANSALDAMPAWRAHFQLDADTEPTYIGEVPLNTTGPIDWGRITDNALLYKPMSN